MDGQGPPPRGEMLWSTFCGPPPVFGRIPVGVGSPPPRPVSVGDMDETGELAPHQPPGNEGPVSGPAIIPELSRRPSGDSDVRQLDGGCLCQQTGRYGLRLPLRTDRATSPMDGIQQRPAGSEIPAGTVQRPSGSPQPQESSTGCRMVSPPTGGEETDSHLGVLVAELVRDTPQREAAPVLLSSSGSPGRL